MCKIARLNERLGIEGELVFKIGNHGALVADVANRQGRGSIAIQGAQVLSWAPADQEAVVWLSTDARFKAGKSLRGGAPVCWPWFGAHPNDPDMSSHGFARNLDWEPLETVRVPEGTRTLMRLVPGQAQRDMWPFEAELSLAITMGERLRLDLATKNLGLDRFELTQAIHTYFRVGDIDSVRIEGLEGREYIDKVGDDAVRRQDGPILIDREVDRIYLGCPGDAVIVDPSLGRRIRVSKRGSNSYVVWNPWVRKNTALGDMGEEGYRNMVCVETTNAGTDVVTVASGDSYRLVTEYAVEAF